MDAHLPEHHQPGRDRAMQKGGDEPDVEGHPQVGRVLPLHQAHHLDVEVVRADVAINADLLGVALQVVVGHARAFADALCRSSRPR